MFKSLSESCCERLTNLGLQMYVDAAPDIIRQKAVGKKETLQLQLSNSLSVLKPLTEELKKLNLVPEECAANRQVIEQWITNRKKAGSYYPPFVTGFDIPQLGYAFEGLLDEALLDEFKVLLPFCQDRLLELGLDTYILEIPKKALSDTERFRKEIEFFKAMTLQKDEALDQWLTENSPKFDYPLLWARKRTVLWSHYENSIDLDLQVDWTQGSSKCMERLRDP